jgi:hypothetical protein
MTEQLLDDPQVGPALEQMGREGVAKEVRMDALRLEPGLLGEPAQDEECPRAGQRAATGVHEEIGPVAAVEVRTPEREVPAHGLGRGPAEGDETLLPALPDDPDDPGLEVDAALLEADRLGDTQTRPVQELDEGAVAEGSRRRSRGGVDQALDLAR